ncbi:MAG: Peptidase [Labilithrix sp.]|nr:Peptidase [Labilithrix sp.]
MIYPQNNMTAAPAPRFLTRRGWASRTLIGFVLTLGVSCRSNNTSHGGDAGAVDADAGTPQLCGPESRPEALAGCAEKTRYVSDLTFIAAERTPGSAHWREVQDLCATRLTELGYEVERQAYASGVNVVGVRRGTSAPNEMVLLSAHYDHITSCAGADDNGSGVAGVLEAARVLAMRPHARTLTVACWDEEERRSDDDKSTNGSRAYAQRARERGDVISGNFVFDGIGFASNEPNTQTLPEGMELFFQTSVQQVQANQSRGDFLAVVLDSASHGTGEHLRTYAATVGLSIVSFEVPADRLTDPSFKDLRRSDHSAFWSEGYPGMLLTDTANFRNPNYHCEGGADTVDTLDHEFAMKVLRATTAAAARTLAGP